MRRGVQSGSSWQIKHDGNGASSKNTNGLVPHECQRVLGVTNKAQRTRASRQGESCSRWTGRGRLVDRGLAMLALDFVNKPQTYGALDKTHVHKLGCDGAAASQSTIAFTRNTKARER